MSAHDRLHGLAFRRFQVLPQHRELIAAGEPVRIGARAFDLLMALIETPGLIVPRDQLMKRVWPRTHVEPNNLEAQVAALRKALGADRDAVVTLPGRGYRFDADVRPIAPDRPLPSPMSSFVGRDKEVEEVAGLLALDRIVSIIGPGGAGKTRLGLEVARRVQASRIVHVAELARIVDPDSLAVALARAVGAAGHGDAPLQAATARLREGPTLLVLDNCEHLADAVAALAEDLARSAPTLRILATSQEALGVEAECVYRLRPLAEPEAVRLFVERVRTADPTLALSQEDLEAAGVICRRLDGTPLAIELAAARAPLMGVPVLAARLDDRFHVLGQGRRTAPDRHRSLEAMLDWSHGLLSAPEQMALRRLSVFRGDFSHEAACAVIAPEGAGDGEHLATLQAKSLVSVEQAKGLCRYRLLETTRLYAAEKLAMAGEADDARRRHADFYRRRLVAATEPWRQAAAEDWLDRHAADADQVRAALEWAFSPRGDAAIGVDLAIASSTLWARLSLFGECERHARAALAAGGARLQPRQELQLLSDLGMSIVPTRRRVAEKAAVCARALEIARALGDQEYESRAVISLLRANAWNRKVAATYENEFLRLARARDDALDRRHAEAVAGVSLMRAGALSDAEPLMAPEAKARTADLSRSFRFGTDGRIHAIANYALLLWLRGRPEEALRAARRALGQARRPEQNVSLFAATAVGGCLLSALTGDRQAAARHAADLGALVETRSLGLGVADALLLNTVFAAPQLSPSERAEQVAEALDNEDELWLSLLFGLYRGWYAEALDRAGRGDEALLVLDSALAETAEGDQWIVPELLRIKGGVLRNAGGEACYSEAMAVARRQGAHGWELRAAWDLARVWERRGRGDDAVRLLESVAVRFPGHGVISGTFQAANC